MRPPNTFSLKYLDANEPRIVVKIRRQLSSDMSVMASRLKWRSRRLVMGLRPPPGGPIAATNWVSMICLKAHGGRLSYQPCSSQSLSLCPAIILSMLCAVATLKFAIVSQYVHCPIKQSMRTVTMQLSHHKHDLEHLEHIFIIQHSRFHLFHV